MMNDLAWLMSIIINMINTIQSTNFPSKGKERRKVRRKSKGRSHREEKGKVYLYPPIFFLKVRKRTKQRMKRRERLNLEGLKKDEK